MKPFCGSGSEVTRGIEEGEAGECLGVEAAHGNQSGILIVGIGGRQGTEAYTGRAVYIAGTSQGDGDMGYAPRLDVAEEKKVAGKK